MGTLKLASLSKLTTNYHFDQGSRLQEALNTFNINGHVRINGLLNSQRKLLELTRDYADIEWESESASSQDTDMALTGGTTHHFAFGLVGKKDTPLYDLATCPEVINCIQSLSGWGSVSLLHAYLFYKAPQGGFTPWHQDSSYLPVRGKTITIWIPLVELPEPNGMVFANGSQDLSINWSEIEETGIHKYFTNRDCTFELVSDLLPGDVDVHDGYVIHCGTDNFMLHTRKVVAIAYVSGEDIYDPSFVDPRLDPNSGDLVMRSELGKAYFHAIEPGDKVKKALPTLYSST